MIFHSTNISQENAFYNIVIEQKVNNNIYKKIIYYYNTLYIFKIFFL